MYLYLVVITVSVVQQDLLQVWLELVVEIIVEFVETMVRFHISPAPQDADVEQVEVPSQVLIDSFLQL
jgi:hypothetical protein